MIGNLLKDILKERTLTYRRVAEDLGIDHASLHRSLKNGGNPEWKTIEMILDYLGYDFKLLKRKEVKPKKQKTRESAGRKGDL